MLSLVLATMVTRAPQVSVPPPFQFLKQYDWRLLKKSPHVSLYRVAASMEELSEVGDHEIKAAGYPDILWVCSVGSPRLSVWIRGWRRVRNGVRPIPGCVSLRADNENGHPGAGDTSVLTICR